MDKSQAGVPEWWENEFKLEMRDFNSLLVYDFRHQSSDYQDILMLSFVVYTQYTSYAIIELIVASALVLRFTNRDD